MVDMDKAAFEEMRNLLEKQGLTVDEGEYSWEAFGSWWLSVNREPPLRIVWDGKEGCITVQEKTEEMFGALPVWKDLWSARDLEDQTPERVLTKVQPFCRA